MVFVDCGLLGLRRETCCGHLHQSPAPAAALSTNFHMLLLFVRLSPGAKTE